VLGGHGGHLDRSQAGFRSLERDGALEAGIRRGRNLANVIDNLVQSKIDPIFQPRLVVLEESSCGPNGPHKVMGG